MRMDPIPMGHRAFRARSAPGSGTSRPSCACSPGRRSPRRASVLVRPFSDSSRSSSSDASCVSWIDFWLDHEAQDHDQDHHRPEDHFGNVKRTNVFFAEELGGGIGKTADRQLQSDPRDQEIGAFSQARETIEQRHEITHHEPHRDDAKHAPGEDDEELACVSETLGKVIGHARRRRRSSRSRRRCRPGDREAPFPKTREARRAALDCVGSVAPSAEWPRDQKCEIAR